MGFLNWDKFDEKMKDPGDGRIIAFYGVIYIGCGYGLFFCKFDERWRYDAAICIIDFYDDYDD